MGGRGDSPCPSLVLFACAGTILTPGVSSRTSTGRIQRRERSEGWGLGWGGAMLEGVVCVCCCHSREERRWLEKQNKAERLQLKREEMARIRTLVGE